jgi:hypothetical protein
VQSPIEDDFFAGLEIIKPFVDKLGSVQFNMQQITTHTEENEGASCEVPSLTDDGRYNIKYLELLKGIAKTIDWSLYPEPAIFLNDRLRGVIIGMRK